MWLYREHRAHQQEGVWSTLAGGGLHVLVAELVYLGRAGGSHSSVKGRGKSCCACQMIQVLTIIQDWSSE